MKKILMLLVVMVIVVSALSAETKVFPGYENLEINTESYVMTYTYNVVENSSLSRRRFDEVKALTELSRVLKEVFEIS
ncbi:hypothetical protein K9M42_01550, partial [Patescibacteria group bacterium]|nr:hypothetical protein [Patescibacteria group bacterium]